MLFSHACGFFSSSFPVQLNVNSSGHQFMFMNVDLSARAAEKALGSLQLSEILKSPRLCFLEQV